MHIIRIFITCFLFTCFSSLQSAEKPKNQLVINLVSIRNGRGLENDQKVMKAELEALGHIVHCYDMKEKKDHLKFADVDIFFQIVDPHYFPYARRQWLIPNPEWFVQPLDLLDPIDLILCRTQEVSRIFSELGKEVYFISYTSRDCLEPTIMKDYYAFAHIAGVSTQKGTLAIVEAWKNNPNFGTVNILQCWGLTPVTNIPNISWTGAPVSEEKLTHLQNRCGIHLCLSETEGFGHYIQEAMSTESVVITTDAPPMNEFITDPRCLVPFNKISYQCLATNYHVSSEAVEEVISNLTKLSHAELQSIGKANRKAFLKRKTLFNKNLDRLLKDRQYLRPE